MVELDHNLVKNLVCLSLCNVLCTMCVSVYNYIYTVTLLNPALSLQVLTVARLLIVQLLQSQIVTGYIFEQLTELNSAPESGGK